MTEEEKKKLSDEIINQRFRKRVNQEEIAKDLNISVPTYRALEKDPSKLDIEQILIISEKLEWNLLQFFLGDVLQNAIK
jgi:transcriptional regulator with XRE-family HTH domain